MVETHGDVWYLNLALAAELNLVSDLADQGSGRSSLCMKELRDNQRCYVCGKDNPAGLQAVFEIDRSTRTIIGRFTPRQTHEGWQGIVHGGIVAALLDEAMVKLAAHLGIHAVSAQITVKFKAPAAPGEELAITGKIVKEASRLIEAEATVLKGLIVVAEAKGKLLKI
jgi:uncharacterized protein (TIGR00369 family)